MALRGVATGKVSVPYRVSIVGIDPGLSATGIALIRQGKVELFTVRTRGKDIAERILHIADFARCLCSVRLDMLVIEHMQIYTQRKSKGDPNDLVNVALVEGAILASIPAEVYRLPKPAEWKGGIDKKIHHPRLKKHVYDLQGRVSEHAWDAFGLALYGVELWQHLYATKKR